MTLRHTLAACLAAALAAGPAGAAPALDGTWSYDWITPLQRNAEDFKTLNVTEAEARGYEAHQNDPAALERDYREKHPGEAHIEEDDGFYAWSWKLARIDGQARSSLIVEPADGQVPWTDAGRARRTALRAQMDGWDGPDQKTEQERCLAGMGAPMGPPLLPGGPESILQIVVTPDAVVLAGEANHEVRIVRLGAAHAPPQLHPWMGDSIGWWEGETLVIETTGFNPGETYRRGFSLSSTAKVTERLRRVSAGELRYSFTVEDAQNYTRPWSGEMPLARFGQPLLEDVCHEGDYDMPTILAGARHEEAVARAAIQAIAQALEPPR